MIPDWKQALAAAARALAQGGRIHIVDFGDLAGLPGPARKMLLGWLGLFHVAPRLELLQLLEQSPGSAAALRLLSLRYAFLYQGAPPQLPK
jgi:S-adenosylmethionine-diacylgycerolhomoserine-N-methlytransferase